MHGQAEAMRRTGTEKSNEGSAFDSGERRFNGLQDAHNADSFQAIAVMRDQWPGSDATIQMRFPVHAPCKPLSDLS